MIDKFEKIAKGLSSVLAKIDFDFLANHRFLGKDGLSHEQGKRKADD